MAVVVKVIYCGAWGYSARFRAFRSDLQAALPATATTMVTFESERTLEVTGFFEVYVDGVLVHSKSGGQGFPNSQEKLQPIVKAVLAKL